MGRVVVDVIVRNLEDYLRHKRGELDAAQVRQLTLQALVDSGATFFCLPRSLIDQLGLAFLQTKETKTVAGPMQLGVFGAAHVEVQGRDCITQILELPEGRQPLLGQIPLEAMDWWVDLRAQRLVGNPEHGGQWMAEVF